jgi:peptidoglycan hydrolase-like protein with peptidoglycan-binding domain
MTRLVYTVLLATALSVVATSAIAAEQSAKPVTHHHMMAHHNVMVHNDTKDIQGLQQTLRDSGFYKGTVTGKWDDSTAKALASYQASKGMPATGTLDETTAKRLGLHAMAREKVGAAKGDSAASGTPKQTMHHKHHTMAHQEMSKMAPATEKKMEEKK